MIKNRLLAAFGLCTAFLVSAAAQAETIKCKIEESRTVFQLDYTGNKGNVSIGTLTSAPKLAYKNVSVAFDAENKAIFAEALPSQLVTKSAATKCALVRNGYRLTLQPKDNKGAYMGQVEIVPNYAPPASGDCKGFPPPDNGNESTFENVFCKKS